MKQYPFHYRKHAMHKVVLVIFGIIALLFLWISVLSFSKMMVSTDSDFTVFLLLGLGLLIPGMSFLLFSIWYYRKTEQFFKSTDWYGITLNGNELKCIFVDFVKKKERIIDLSTIQQVELRSYKGRRYFSIKTTVGFKTIPAHELSDVDLQEVMSTLNRF